MAQAISMYDWIDSLQELGGDVACEVHVIKVLEDAVIVRLAIRAGELILWEGEDELLGEGGALGLAGFNIRGGDLVLEDFEEGL